MDQQEFKEIIARNIKHASGYKGWHQEVVQFISQNLLQPIKNDNFKQLQSLIKAKPVANISEITERLALLFGDPELLEYYFKSLKREGQDFITRLTWEGSLPYSDAYELFGEDLVIISNKGRNGVEPVQAHKRWYPYLFNGDYVFGYLQQTVAQKMESGKFYYELPPFMRMAYARILPKPKGYFLEGIQIPKKWQVLLTETTVFEQLPAVLTYIQQDKIKRTTKGFLNPPAVKAMQKKLRLQAFPNDPGHIMSLVINGLMPPFYKFPADKSITGVLQYVFHQQDLKPAMLDAALFPLNGIRKVDYYQLQPDSLKTVFGLLKILPVGGWITLDNIQQYVATHFFNLIPVKSYFDVQISTSSIYYQSFNEGGTAAKDQATRQILVTGALLMAAAYGLLDLAYDPQDPTIWFNDTVNYQDCRFSACRLTPLGAHIMQESKDYIAPATSSAPSFTLDPESLQISYTGNPLQATGLLENWTSPSGDGTLLFDLVKVLKNNSHEMSFKNSIEKFKKSVAKPLPAYWKEQFEQVLERSGNLSEVSDVMVFKISPKASELHQLIARDEILRKLIIKAEQFTIIVERSHKQAFYNRLATLGYLPGLGYPQPFNEL